MSENCVICLEELCSSFSTIGTIVPCGHVVHRSCFQDFITAHNSANVDCSPSSSSKLPRCPICKHKSKKFIPLFLSFDQPPSLCEPTTATETIESLSSQNCSLRSKIQQLTSLSKDQSDILLDLLPKYDLAEDDLHAVQVEKNELNKQLHALEAENVELITDWNEIEIKLEVLKSENMALKRQVKDGKGEIRFYAHKEVAAELRFQKQKKKRKRVETEKAEKDRELEEEKQEIRKVKKENVALAGALEATIEELEILKKRVRKLKKRYQVNGTLTSGKENRTLKMNRGRVLTTKMKN